MDQVVKRVIGVVIITVVVAVLIISLSFLFCGSAPYRDVSPQTIEYTIDPSIPEAEKEILMEAAIQATAMWSGQNSNLTFVLTDKQDVLQIQTGVPWFAKLGEKDPKGLAKCPIWDTDATNCIVYVWQDYLNPTFAYPKFKIQLVNTLAHEFGHVLGLGHYSGTEKNHLMSNFKSNPTGTPYDTKGYVVPAKIPLP